MTRPRSAPAHSLNTDMLAARVALCERHIAEMLAPLEPVSATTAWFDTLRAIEECINLPTVDWDDDALEQSLYEIPVLGLLSDPAALAVTRARLIDHFSEPFANRFVQLLVRGSAVARAFAGYGLPDAAAGFLTVGTMIGYLQSRRRHYVALLHAMPLLCKGQQRVNPLDTFNLFLPLVETQGLPLWSAHEALLINASCDKLGIRPATSLDRAALDPMFLEPERSRITEMPMTDAGLAMLEHRETLMDDRLFSAAELRNDILLLEAAYAEFDLTGSDFADAATFVRQMSRLYVERDYWVAIKPAALRSLMEKLQLSGTLKAALVHTDATYFGCLATYTPLVLVGGMYRSTVSLLSRFLYHWRAVSLDRRKRYQIRSGFIFEKAVAERLERQGFAVQNITRINHHEFDVVTLRGGVIWNVQCKNNFLDLERLEAEPARFATYNHRLVRGYERALTKESHREHLLRSKLATEEVHHIVVSRFPVVTDNPRIVPFSRIDTVAAYADQPTSDRL